MSYCFLENEILSPWLRRNQACGHFQIDLRKVGGEINALYFVEQSQSAQYTYALGTRPAKSELYQRNAFSIEKRPHLAQRTHQVHSNAVNKTRSISTTVVYTCSYSIQLEARSSDRGGFNGCKSKWRTECGLVGCYYTKA